MLDGFIFYNELDLLSYRLELLAPVVDFFIIVEAERTFTGQPKPLFYLDCSEEPRFARYKDKIRHVVVPGHEMQDPNPWTNEATQRNAIVRGIPIGSMGVLMVSDVDEIPNLAAIPRAVIGPMSLSMDFYYYNLNTRVLTPWLYPKIAPLPLPLGLSPNELRQLTGCPVVVDAGWHLSYFGDPVFIQNKIANFSHQELNVSAFTDLDRIQRRIAAASDLFDRDGSHLMSISVADNARLPPRYTELLWRHYAF